MTPSIRGMTPDEIRELLRRPGADGIRRPTTRPVLEPRIHPNDMAELRFDHDR